MYLYKAHGDVADVDRIERFLRRQDGVIDANVWIKNGTILASVTVSSDADHEEEGLIEKCEKALGLSQTPAMIMLQRAMRPAA